jgi:hypothetical protein
LKQPLSSPLSVCRPPSRGRVAVGPVCRTRPGETAPLESRPADGIYNGIRHTPCAVRRAAITPRGPPNDSRKVQGKNRGNTAATLLPSSVSSAGPKAHVFSQAWASPSGWLHLETGRESILDSAVGQSPLQVLGAGQRCLRVVDRQSLELGESLEMHKSCICYLRVIQNQPPQSS